FGGDNWDEYVSAENSDWISCADTIFKDAFGDCSAKQGAYILAEFEPGNDFSLTPGYYVIGKGVTNNDDGDIIAESLPVFARLAQPFSINSALTVLGGIEDLEGNKWYPSSNNARISNGDVDGISAVYYEGDPHPCEADSNPQVCYENLSKDETFDGGVAYGGYAEDTGSSNRIGDLYDEFSSSGELVTNEEDLIFQGKNEECTAENSQFAFVKSFVISGSEKFCGVVIVWGGLVDIPADATINGNASIEGFMLAASFGENEDGTPNFGELGTVNLAINGGGEKGSVYFDSALAESAFEKVGVSYDDFVLSSGSSVTKKITSWN
ncbi:MAG TPA: hypothetical protein VLO13_05455, partial [Halomonas sp.]|nr:hypothetical protein [Halomonas sp.]